jgi:hypothetical protein
LNVRNFITVLMAASALAAVDPQADMVSRKLDAIESGKARPGAVFVFTVAELNAWVSVKASTIVPQGFRKPRLELGSGTATGYALVDFLKVRNSAGLETNWFIAKLIEGEKPVKAVAEIHSANGRMTVHLARVEIGGLAVSGSTLDFLIHTFFLPLYPNAKIDEPVELADGIDRIQVMPDAARVYIKKK